MREVQFLDDAQILAAADGGRGRAPFADAIHGEYGGLGKPRGIKRARGVAQMVLGEQQAITPVEIGGKLLQLAADQVFLEQLFAQPQRHRDRKRRKTARRKAT